MFARLASEAFSRAISSAPFGRSNETSVTARPVDSNVPDVCVSRSNFRLAHEPRTSGARIRVRSRRRDMRENITEPVDR
jgi:hypothetical protein